MTNFGRSRERLATKGYVFADSGEAEPLFRGLGRVGRAAQLHVRDRDSAEEWSLSVSTAETHFPGIPMARSRQIRPGGWCCES